MRFDIITIFPNIFDSYINESILGRAQKNKLIKIKTHDLRKHATNKHKSVDDSPYGGGFGMVMMVEPIYKTLMSLKKLTQNKKTKTILLTPRGEKFTQKKAKEFSSYENLILISGRYEGVDERVTEFIDEEISIGDYVLSGGEIPAMVIIESVSRLIPGVLGKDESSKEESWSDENSAEYPHYTRPEIFRTEQGKELKVPKTLISGNHEKIANWRKNNRKFNKENK